MGWHRLSQEVTLELRPVNELDSAVQSSVGEYFLFKPGELQVQKSTQRWPRAVTAECLPPCPLGLFVRPNFPNAGSETGLTETSDAGFQGVEHRTRRRPFLLSSVGFSVVSVIGHVSSRRKT